MLSVIITDLILSIGRMKVYKLLEQHGALSFDKVLNQFLKNTPVHDSDNVYFV